MLYQYWLGITSIYYENGQWYGETNLIVTEGMRIRLDEYMKKVLKQVLTMLNGRGIVGTNEHLCDNDKLHLLFFYETFQIHYLLLF